VRLNFPAPRVTRAPANTHGISAATTRKSVSKEDVAVSIEAISQHAQVRGLPAEMLEMLIDSLTIVPNHLDTGAAGRMVKLLLPRRKVTESVVVKVVAGLGWGKKKPPVSTQVRIPHKVTRLWC
jgi:centromere protein I